MSKQITKVRMKDLFLIFVATTILTVGIKYFFDPAGLVTGGVSGLAIIIKFFTGTFGPVEIPLWVSNIVINVPIFLFAFKTEGFRSVLRTTISWLIMSVELAVLPELDLIPTDNLLLVAIYGGICFGLGTGILLTVRATSGGTDMLAKSLHYYFPRLSMGQLIEILDGCVVILGAYTFNIEHTLYAIICVFIMGKLTDWVINNGKSAKMVMIISDCNEKIAEDILTDMDRGVTGLKGKGMYSNEDKMVLMCICSKGDIVQMKDIVKQYDKKAFFVVSDVGEAMGEGFVENWYRAG